MSPWEDMVEFFFAPDFETEEESYNVFFRSLQVAASGSHHPSLPILTQLTHYSIAGTITLLLQRESNLNEKEGLNQFRNI